MSREWKISHKLVDYDYKIDYPNETEKYDGGGNNNESESNKKASTVGTDKKVYKVGLSASASLCKTEANLCKKWNAKVGSTGACISGALGIQIGKETEMASIVEPSLLRVEGIFGPVYGSVGLNGTTGLRYNKDGFKFGLVGFGATCGIGRRYTIDTPFCSGGFLGQTHVINEDDETEDID